MSGDSSRTRSCFTLFPYALLFPFSLQCTISSDKMSTEHEHMDMQKKNEIAHERYGKPYAELTSNEQKSVGGVFGGEKRKTSMTEATGERCAVA
ncbi:hypothetical protein DUNSADRAFT_10022 [Dunaliella salina]|uniref:Uncharacterized protein n=1 Tax=Dunaliella salina TaxID=3046 RepID=A0ABQ7GG90_DUNSA|nr:hypothetical protein DUNSADRAFT_10022 [Dunaliella salina]|eukprot:KAF5833606.1 hypothetical protein DUNSADRAFT_10022 [Dunaliella salina]